MERKGKMGARERVSPNQDYPDKMFRSRPWIEFRFLRQLFPSSFFFLADFFRHLHSRDHVEIARDHYSARASRAPRTRSRCPFCVPAGILMLTDPLRVGTEMLAPSAASHGYQDPNQVIKIRALHPEIRMTRQPHAQIQIPRRSAAAAGIAATGDAQFLSIANARRNFHLMRLRGGNFACTAASHGHALRPLMLRNPGALRTNAIAPNADSPHRSRHRFFQGHH